jgi:hypothetical protein
MVAVEAGIAIRLADSQKCEKRTHMRWYDAEVVGAIACPSILAAVATPGPVPSTDRAALKSLDCKPRVEALVVGRSQL